MRHPEPSRASRLASLRLANFRGYADVCVPMEARLTVLAGGNAQGKTNFLRAVQVLGLGDGRSGGAEQVRFGESQGAVEGRVLYGNHEDRMAVTMGRSGSARLILNGKQVSRPRWVGRLPVLFVGPADREKVTGPPSARRALLDDLLEQGSPAYLAARKNYQRALRQRNRALSDPGAAPEAVEIWEEPLARHGGVMAAHRVAALSALSPRADAWHGELGGRSAKSLSLNYESGAWKPEEGRKAGERSVQPTSPAEWERLLRERFAGLRERERAAGTSLAGPHRDEVGISLEGHLLRETGSSGEIWTAILSLVFSSAEYLGQKLGAFPLLLLDDVLAALDSPRSARLLAILEQYDPQAVLATAQPVPRHGGRTYRVEGHRITFSEDFAIGEKAWPEEDQEVFARS